MGKEDYPFGSRPIPVPKGPFSIAMFVSLQGWYLPWQPGNLSQGPVAKTLKSPVRAAVRAVQHFRQLTGFIWRKICEGIPMFFYFFYEKMLGIYNKFFNKLFLLAMCKRTCCLEVLNICSSLEF